MWCTEVAAGAFLTFRNVVSGDIGDHWRSSFKLLYDCQQSIAYSKIR
jgi:hypothetical protein